MCVRIIERITFVTSGLDQKRECFFMVYVCVILLFQLRQVGLVEVCVHSQMITFQPIHHACQEPLFGD